MVRVLLEFTYYFRYNKEGEVIDTRLLDLQIVSPASIAVDLNHLIFSSLEISLIKSNLTHLLKRYYDVFERVYNAAELPVPFTFEELELEFEAKKKYGLMMGIVMVPFVALEKDDLVDIGGINNEEDAERVMKQQEERLLEVATSGGRFQKRFCALIDEFGKVFKDYEFGDLSEK